MGLDVTLYDYVVNLNDLAAHSSSGCGMYDIWIWGFVFGSRLNYRSLSIQKKKTWLEVDGVDVASKTITQTVN